MVPEKKAPVGQSASTLTVTVAVVAVPGVVTGFGDQFSLGLIGAAKTEGTRAEPAKTSSAAIAAYLPYWMPFIVICELR
jgi:hypothetical protein